MSKSNGSHIPPHSRDAEESVLGAMMLSEEVVPKIIDKISNPSAFYCDKNRSIYSAMMELHHDSVPVDQITVSDKLKQSGLLEKVGGSYYITGLLDSTPSVSNIDYYIDIVIDKAQLRELISLGITMTADGYDASEGTTELLELYRQKIDQLSEDHSNENYNYLDELSQVIKEIQGEIKPGLHTGFESLDNITGGFHRGNLIVLGARTSQGKTTLAINFAFSIASSGKKVLFASLEMTKTELFKKIISLDTGIPYEKLRGGWLTKKQRNQIADRENTFFNLSNLIIADDLFSLKSIYRSVKNNKPDLVIVDFIQMMRFAKGESRAYQIEEIMKGFKSIAKLENCVVVVLSQINRDSDKLQGNIPRLENLKGSGSLEEGGDIVMLIHWAHKYDLDKPEENVQIVVAKNRHGKTGKITLKFDPNIGKYSCDN